MESAGIYVVTLPHRLDRRAHIEELLKRVEVVTYSSEIGCAFDQEAVKQQIAQGVELFPWQIKSDNEWWKRPLKYGEVGCTLSHICCWEHARFRDLERCIVFEDDAVFDDNIWDVTLRLCDELSSYDPQWDLLYLGRERIEPDAKVFSEFCVPGFSYCTYGYVLSRSGIETVCAFNLRKCIMPLDEFLPATYCIHPRPDVAKCVLITLRTYGLLSDIVTEGDERVFGSDTENSDYIELG